MGSNIILSFFMISVLQFLWGLINALQMVVFTVLFAVNFPSNCSGLMIGIMKLTNLEIIEVDDYIKMLLGLHN